MPTPCHSTTKDLPPLLAQASARLAVALAAPDSLPNVAAKPAAATRVTGEELERRQRVHAAMQLAGVSVAAWAKAHGFNHQIVAGVLAGRFTGTRGEAHAVCVALKLKSGPQVMAPTDFDAAAVLGESIDAEGGTA